jgi:DNA-3-methyladenine glycosylase I
MEPAAVLGDDGTTRCWWGDASADYRAYHDGEWGMPIVDDDLLFERLVLEGFQSGLSWLTILRRRPGFRAAFHQFDIAEVAAMTPGDVERLLGDTSIIRHRGKVESTINNARRALDLAAEVGSLAGYFWSYEPADAGRAALQATSPESTAMARDLKRRGFTFVGSTTAYAFMQATGIVNDHLRECGAYARVETARSAMERPIPRPTTPG